MLYELPRDYQYECMKDLCLLRDRRSKRLSKENLKMEPVKSDSLPPIPDNLPSVNSENDEMFQDPNNLNVCKIIHF